MTILVAMHLGSQTMLIADKYVFSDKYVPGQPRVIKHVDYVKVHQNNNFSTVSGGSGSAMDTSLSYLRDKTITGETELRGMSEHLIEDLIKPWGQYLPGEITLMYVSAHIDNQAKLFTVVHDELKTGGRLKQLTEHEAGEILFAIPRTITPEDGAEFKREVTEVVDAFMAGQGKDLRPDDAVAVAGLAKSVCTVLNKLSKATKAISPDFDLSVLSASGHAFTGYVNLLGPEKVVLTQKRGEDLPDSERHLVANKDGIVVAREGVERKVMRHYESAPGLMR